MFHISGSRQLPWLPVLAMTIALAGVLIAPRPAEAGRDGVYRDGAYQGARHARRYSRHRGRRHYSRRDYDNLPVREARPPNSAHLIYDMYPLWAAEAFQPKRRY